MSQIPIGWLRGLKLPLITTGKWWCRWYTSHRPKPIFTKRTSNWWCLEISLNLIQKTLLLGETPGVTAPAQDGAFAAILSDGSVVTWGHLKLGLKYTCSFLCTCVCGVYIYTHKHTCIYIYTYMYMYVHMYIFHLSLSMSVSISIHMFMRAYFTVLAYTHTDG